MCDIGRIRKLCKKDILSALHHLTCDLSRSTYCGLPERHIEYVMQSKWDQRTFDQTKDQRSDIARTGHQPAQRIDSILYCRPHKVH